MKLFARFKETGVHALTFGLGETFTKAIGILLIPVYTRYLTTSDYGALSLLLISSSIAIAVFGLGLNSALFRSYYDYEDDKNRRIVFGTAFYIMITSVCGLVTLGYFISPYVSNLIFGSSKYVKYFQIIFIISSLELLKGLPFAIYRAKKLSKRYSFLNVMFFIMRLSLIIYFVVYAKEGVRGVLIGSLLGSLIAVTVLFITVVNQIKFTLSAIEFKKLVGFGTPLILTNLAGVILTMSDRFFLRYFSNLSEVGLYNLGYQFGMIISVLLVGPFQLIWSPMMFSVKKEEYAKEYYSKTLTYFLFLGLMIFLGISLLSRNVIMIFSHESFWAAYRVVPLIALSYILFGIRAVVNVGIALKRKTIYASVAFVTAAVSNLLLNYIFIPKYGMMGAAFATLISYFIMCAMNFSIARRLYKIQYEWFRIVKLALGATLIYLIGTNVDTGNVWLSLITKMGMVLSFPFLLIPVNFYEEREKQKIAEILRVYFPRLSDLINWKVYK